MNITKQQLLKFHKRLVPLLLDEAFYGHAGRKGKAGGSVAKKAAGVGAGAAADVVSPGGRTINRVNGALHLTPDNIDEFAADAAFHKEVVGEAFPVEWHHEIRKKHLDNAVRTYVDESDTINEYLRTGEIDDDDDEDAEDNYNELLESMCDDIAEAIDMSTVKASVYVYRGMTSNYVSEIEKPGSVFKDKGFVSSTIDINTAIDFSSKKKPSLVRIRLEKGTKAAYLGISMNKQEKEVLIQRDTTFKTVSKTKLKVSGKEYDVLDVVIVSTKKTPVKEQLSETVNKKKKYPYNKYAWNPGDVQ